MNFSVKNFFSKCDDGNYFQGKFYFEGAISGDNFPQRQLSSGAIIRGGGGNHARGNYPGGNFPWGQLP